MRGKKILDRSQTVGYVSEKNKKVLIITLSEKMAQRMKKDGWDVVFAKDLGYFIQVKLEEGDDSQSASADQPGGPESRRAS